MYLDWLVAGGFPALLLFLALLGSAVVALYSQGRTLGISRTERILLLSALAAYCFQGFFVFDNLFSYVPMVAILAIVYGSASRPVEKLTKLPALSDNDFVTFALPIGVIALALIVWFVNVPGIRAAGDLITAITPAADPAVTNIDGFKQAYADGSFANQEITERVFSFAESAIGSQQVSPADQQTIYTYAMRRAQALVAAIPNDARIRLEYALALRAGGDYPDALTQVHIAEQLSPAKQGIIIEEGIEEWQSGNLPAAQAAFNEAYNLDTSFADVGVYAAAGDVSMERFQRAKLCFSSSTARPQVDQDIVLYAYYQAKDFPTLLLCGRSVLLIRTMRRLQSLHLQLRILTRENIAQARAEVETAMSQHPEDASEGASILTQIPGGSRDSQGRTLKR